MVPYIGAMITATTPQIAVGSRVRKSPYWQSTVDAGVTQFTVYNHMYMPTSYGDPEGEYKRLTEAVAIWDVAAERQVEISGPDARKLTQLLSARNIMSCRPGRARYAPMCDHRGHLINDPVALCLDDDRFWLSIADSDVLLWAKAVAGERGADVEVFEPDVSPLAIQGPKAVDLARDLFGGSLVDSLGMFHHTPVELDGIPMVLCRSGWSKRGGYEMFLTDGSRGNELWQKVVEAGKSYGIGPGTPNQQERIESGLLSFGSDTDPDIDPVEAGLGAFVSVDMEHDFIGKEALRARLADAATRRVIVNVAFDGEVPRSENPWPASCDGQPAGRVHNAVWSPKLARVIGLALVPSAVAVAGNRLEVDTPDGPRMATISEAAFGAIQ